MLKTQASKLGLLGLEPHVAKQFYPPPANCVLYLPGYPPSTTVLKDHSGQGNDGTITGATPIRLPSGQRALSFNGTSDYVDFGAVSLIGTGLTTWAWVNTNAIVANGAVIGRDGAATRGWYYCILVSGGNRLFGESVIGGTSITGGSVMSDGTWYHTAFVWDGTNIYLYLNGVSDATPVATATLSDGSDVLGIGYAPPYTGKFKGNMALWGACNVALSAAQLLSRYQQERHLFGV